MDSLLEHTATTYSYSTLTEMTGDTLRSILEDVSYNIFNPDPDYQQGVDMVRVGWMSYTIDPSAAMGSRISEMRLGRKLIEPSKYYRVAGWAPVNQGATGDPIWDLVARWLRKKKPVPIQVPNVPRIKNVSSHPGLTYRCGSASSLLQPKQLNH